MFVCFFAWKGGQRVVSGDRRFRSILASSIGGNVGILGTDYPGYFDVGNTGNLDDC